MYRKKGQIKRLIIHDVEKLRAKYGKILRSIQRKKQYLSSSINRKIYSIMRLAQAVAVRKVPIESGRLARSIKIEYTRDTDNNVIEAKLHVSGRGAKYAKYVEFGTGIIGMESPHERLPSNWTYDENDRGEAGWSFRSKTRVRGFKKRESSFFLTKGQPARAFMFAAYEEIKELLQTSKSMNVNGEVIKIPKEERLNKLFTVRFTTKNGSPVVIVKVSKRGTRSTE